MADLPVFQIVLVDIKKAAQPFNGRVVCVKKNMYDPHLKFVAISYRWGEVAEQVVDTANDDDDNHENDYLAHITSFSLTDFYELCQYMAAEVDLQYIDYVWIDAISINQQNKEQRKATIRYMNQIYHKATYILAVPDLHLAYLKSNSANFHTMELVRKHALYIYYTIANLDEGCDDIERIWCYNLLCDRTLTPSQYLVFFRHQLKSKLASIQEKTSIPHEGCLACLHLLQPILTSSSSISKHVQQHIDKYWFLNQTLNKSMVPEIQHIEKKRSRSHLAWRLDISSDHPDHTHRPRQLDLAWINHPWHKLWTTTIIPRWNQAYYTTTNELREAFAFLGYLVDEWSNRAWVISEYLIAKQKHDNQQVPMKFIFLLLRPTFPSYSTDRSRFFNVFDPRLQQHQQEQKNPWRSMGVEFRHQLITRLGYRGFIDMVVASNALRGEDRFHSILPLWHKYKHIIVDNDTITSWNITNMSSVVVKLYEMMDNLDKLRLLHACSQHSGTGILGHHDLVFPTFSNQLKPTFLKIYELEDNKPNSSTTLPNITSINLISSSPPRLRIIAKKYYRRREEENENNSFFDPYYQSFGKKIHHAPLEFQKGQLVAMIVPLFCQGDGSRIHLIGDEKSNRWILVRYIKFYHWRDLFSGPHQDLKCFDIF